MTRRCRCHPYRAQGAGAAIIGTLLLLAVIGWPGVAILAAAVVIVVISMALEDRRSRR